MLRLLLVLAPLVALLDGWIHRPGFPDLTLALLLPLFLRGEGPWILPVAFLAAVFREALDPSRPWLFPLFVVLVYGALRALRVRVNLRLWSLRVVLVTLVVLLDLLLLHATDAYPLDHPALWITGGVTVLLSLVFLVESP